MGFNDTCGRNIFILGSEGKKYKGSINPLLYKIFILHIGVTGKDIALCEACGSNQVIAHSLYIGENTS